MVAAVQAPQAPSGFGPRVTNLTGRAASFAAHAADLNLEYDSGAAADAPQLTSFAGSAGPAAVGTAEPWQRFGRVDEKVLRSAAAAGGSSAPAGAVGPLAADAVDAVHSLASARTSVPMGSDGDTASTTFHSHVGEKLGLYDRLFRKVELNDFPDDAVPAFGRCLSELTKCESTYQLQGSTTVRPYDPN